MLKTYFNSVTVPRPAFLGGGNWELSNLSAISVLFGKNGSGKSLFLRALRDSAFEDSHYVVPERGGDLGFQPQHLQEQMSSEQRRDVTRGNFAQQYRRQIIARIMAYLAVRGATRDNKLIGNPQELESFLAKLLPDFGFTFVGSAQQPYELVRQIDLTQIGNVEQLSSGEAQILTLALDVLTIAAIWDMEKRKNRLMLIDEPDAHVHPDLQVRFADFLIQVGQRFDLQFSIATHSTTLLAALGQFGGDEASIVYIDRTKSAFHAVPFSKEAKELAACLGGHALMGPLFGVPLLLVEGDDDYRIWSQVPRYNQVSFSVIPTNGDEIYNYQKSLERILAALREPGEPSGFALLDGDKAIPQANPQSPQDHIQFIGLACHEAENLYLTDEVLALLETDWATASALIVDKANEFGQKAGFLATANDWDRNTIDIHEYMDQLTQIIDDKNVHWTIRVAKAVGDKRPTGQLGIFLSDDVVNALWGPEPVVEAIEAVAEEAPVE